MRPSYVDAEEDDLRKRLRRKESEKVTFDLTFLGRKLTGKQQLASISRGRGWSARTELNRHGEILDFEQLALNSSELGFSLEIERRPFNETRMNSPATCICTGNGQVGFRHLHQHAIRLVTHSVMMSACSGASVTYARGCRRGRMAFQPRARATYSAIPFCSMNVLKS